jgi:microcompartment protein CcmL/EutN
MVEAIGVLELDSIAAGVEVADAMVKAAPIELVDTFMVTPGKYVVIVHGDPASVQASVEAGREMASGTLLDWLLIPFLDPQVLPAFRNETPVPRIEALGLIETSSIVSGVVAADAAAKAAAVQLVQLHLGRGIGGKAMLTLTGALTDVQAAVEAGSERARRAGRLVATRVIPQPHADLASGLSGGLRRVHVQASVPLRFGAEAETPGAGTGAGRENPSEA